MIKFEQGVTAVSSTLKRPDVAANGTAKTSQTEAIATKQAVTNNGSTNNVSVPVEDIDFAARQTRNDLLNNIASSIRSLNSRLDNVDNLFQEKRQEIVEYEKQYPPFQDQSSEKVEFLNSISSLKKQVDALIIVQDNSELNLSLVDTDLPEFNFADDLPEQPSFDFPQQAAALSSGENGLKIASIGTTASDAEIRQFSQDLEVSTRLLGEKRQELDQEVRLIAGELNKQEKSIGKELLESDQQALFKSEEITRALSALPNQSIGHEQGQNLLESLR